MKMTFWTGTLDQTNKYSNQITQHLIGECRFLVEILSVRLVTLISKMQFLKGLVHSVLEK